MENGNTEKKRRKTKSNTNVSHRRYSAKGTYAEKDIKSHKLKINL